MKRDDTDSAERSAEDARANHTCEPIIRDLIEARMSRRTILKSIVAAGAYGLFGGATPASHAADRGTSLNFTEIGRSLDGTHHVAAGYDVQVLIRWGDPIHRSGPRFMPGRQTAAEQEAQFGANNDFVAFMPLPAGSSAATRGLLCVNHEYTSSHLFWPGVTAGNAISRLSREQCETEMAAQGHTVIEINRSAGAWRLVDGSRYNRRISARSTPMRVAGPGSGHTRLRTRADPAGLRVVGTLANCAGGVTPWGTVLSAEENFNYYFTGGAARGPEAAARKRYGIDGRALNAWGRHIERFDLDREPNEPNRFGWIVEIDPYDPASIPVKRTALGRFKHECASTALSHDGRMAVYSGDDEAFEYVYRFVTRRAYDPAASAANRELLDDGTLYVAKFETNGMMRWLPLVFGQGPLTAANGFSSQADIVIEARRAADLLGATPMDRPEDMEAHPVTGRIYVVLTFNERRKPDQVDAANPRGPNRFGHIIEIIPPSVNGKPDHASAKCAWEIYLLAGDPADPGHGARYHAPVSASGWLACPDNLAFDPGGRIWIATDGQDEVMGVAESLYAAETAGARRGATRCFFNGPRGAELTGPAFTPDGKTLFLAIQHPAAEKGSTFDKPSTRWPDFEDGLPPRSSVVAITKADGGEIGS